MLVFGGAARRRRVCRDSLDSTSSFEGPSCASRAAARGADETLNCCSRKPPIWPRMTCPVLMRMFGYAERERGRARDCTSLRLHNSARGSALTAKPQ